MKGCTRTWSTATSVARSAPTGSRGLYARLRVIRSGKPCYLDNLYEKYLVGVELDGLEAHPRSERWRDFRRDDAGAADGIITLRYGWSDVTRSPCAVAAQIAAVLRRRGWTAPVRPCGPNCGIRGGFSAASAEKPPS